MPPSPAEPRPDPRDVLRAIERAYDGALHAVTGGDVDTCARLLDAVEALLRAPTAPVADACAAELPALRAAAAAAHGRLLALLGSFREDTARELARVRTGRRALAGYAGERQIGQRLRSDA
ncbi:MAG: hypothetical protein AB7O97_03615 [Planctomycetota bacterium]